jgi:hypothetical protein
MINPWLRVNVLIGWGVTVAGSGVDVAEDTSVRVSEGSLVGVIVAGSSVPVGTAEGVSEAKPRLASHEKPGSRNSRVVKYTRPSNTKRLNSTRSRMPNGVIRIVQPTPRCLERGERDGIGISDWLVISEIQVYFTRCKKYTQAQTASWLLCLQVLWDCVSSLDIDRYSPNQLMITDIFRLPVPVGKTLSAAGPRSVVQEGGYRWVCWWLPAASDSTRPLQRNIHFLAEAAVNA